YLYESDVDARNATQYGGTGFLVGVESSRFPRYFSLYAVTCKHVVKSSDEPYPVIRINTKSGKSDVIGLSSDDWIAFDDVYPNEQHDIAVHEIGITPLSSKYEASFMELGDAFISKEAVLKYNIGIGDDVYMLGRYIDHD